MIDIKITPNKNQDKNTTSHKFKQDLVEFFHGKELESCLEIGTNRGYSTLILSQLFGWVTTLEINRENIEFAKEVCKERKNIEFLQHDVYNDKWVSKLHPNYDVVFIDCAHDYESVKQDYNNACDLEPKYIVFDDYGLPEENPAVKEFVDELLKDTDYWNGIPIGMWEGTELRSGRPLRAYEGMILYECAT